MPTSAVRRAEIEPLGSTQRTYAAVHKSVAMGRKAVVAKHRANAARSRTRPIPLGRGCAGQRTNSSQDRLKAEPTEYLPTGGDAPAPTCCGIPW